MQAYQGTENLEIMGEAKNYNHFLVDLVLKHRGAAHRAVDFGAGIGTIAEMVRGRGLDVVCVEPDDAQRRVLAGRGLVAVPDLEALGDGTIAYLYTLNVLEHIPDDGQALEAIARKLAERGRVFIYVPAFPLLFSSMDRKVGHFRRYRKGELVRRIEKTGLKVDRARYADSVGFGATLVYKLAGSGSGALNRRAIILFDRIAFPVSRLLDRAVGWLFGKNVYAVATKEAQGPSSSAAALYGR